MEFIREWAYCIVSTIVLFTIVEMVVPSGNMKKSAIFFYLSLYTIDIQCVISFNKSRVDNRLNFTSGV